jgi:predicted RNase H-like HicB family nuclease
MELPVLIERLPDGTHYSARLGEPFNLTAEGSSPDDAQHRLTDALRRRLEQGAELRSISVRPVASPPPEGGWLPNDELTREWLQAVRQFRDEADEADRRRLSDGPAEAQAPS